MRKSLEPNAKGKRSRHWCCSSPLSNSRKRQLSKQGIAPKVAADAVSNEWRGNVSVPYSNFLRRISGSNGTKVDTC